jgi:very-short-patch-repair endonuclease
MPALIPQVYLHYDPYSVKKYGYNYLLRQRMDFLLLLSNNKRIVIEIDGIHHYTENEKASPKVYSKMVAADRDLKLLGYELYRFGGYELMQTNAKAIIEDFFESLFQKHSIK